MNNIVVPYNLLESILKQEFEVAKQSDEIFSNISLIVSDEQMFIKTKDKIKTDCIYVVLRFNQAAINFGQATVNLEISVLGLPLEIKKTQSFLNAFVSLFNLNTDKYIYKDDNYTITQLYMTPRSALNFNETNNNFRTLFSITSTIIIGDSTIRMSSLQFYIDGDEEKEPEIIPVLGYNDVTENSLNPQPYPNTNGRTKSYGSFQTFAFTISIYPDGSKKLVQKIMKMKFGVDKSHQNDSFYFKFVFDNMDLDFENENEHEEQNTTEMWTYKCNNADFVQKIGEIPVITLTFSL